MSDKPESKRRATLATLIAFPLCVALGFFLIVQFRTVQKVGGSVSLQRAQELTARVQQLSAENDALRDRLTAQEKRLSEYEMSFKNKDLVALRLTEDLNAARMEAGMIDVVGTGVRVVIQPKAYSGEGFVLKNVLDEDLLLVVNEMNASAAEAVSVNGERVIATTEIRNAGNFINVNRRSCSSPFTIDAIGDPATLEAALMLRGGAYETLSEFYDIRVTRLDQARIPKYNGVIQFHYAAPVAAETRP